MVHNGAAFPCVVGSHVHLAAEVRLYKAADLCSLPAFESLFLRLCSPQECF